MEHLLITTIATVLVVGCGPSPPDISIQYAAEDGNIEAIKQHLAAGADVNMEDLQGRTSLHYAAGQHILFGVYDQWMDAENREMLGNLQRVHKETVALLIAKGADVNAKEDDGRTPLDWAENDEIADLIRKHGGKTGDELEAEGK